MRYTGTRTTILQLAREMAQSGQYHSWRTIEMHLRVNGLPYVPEVLDDADIRRDLDHCCGNARPGMQ